MSSLGLPGWFRHAYFEYHAHVRLRFKLASGLGEPWTRDGGIPQGGPLSMMSIVALYLPWCRYLATHGGVQPQLYADNLKCVSGDPGLLLRAARFATSYVRLVGQEPAPTKCVLLSTSREVRKGLKEWVLSQDVRDMGGTFGDYLSWMVFDFGCEGSSGHFSFGSYLCSLPGFFMVGFEWSGLCVFLLLCMGLKLLCLLLMASGSFGPLSMGWCGLFGSL